LENLGKNECVRYIRPTNIEIRWLKNIITTIKSNAIDTVIKSLPTKKSSELYGLHGILLDLPKIEKEGKFYIHFMKPILHWYQNQEQNQKKKTILWSEMQISITKPQTCWIQQ
jgi:hypothetical protein